MLTSYTGMNSNWLFYVLVSIMRFGDTCCYAGIWIAHPRMFPTLFAVTSMGIASFFSRGCVILAPMVAEIAFPTPMIVFVAMTMVSGFTSLFLIENEAEKEDKEGALDDLAAADENIKHLAMKHNQFDDEDLLLKKQKAV